MCIRYLHVCISQYCWHWCRSREELYYNSRFKLNWKGLEDGSEDKMFMRQAQDWDMDSHVLLSSQVVVAITCYLSSWKTGFHIYTNKHTYRCAWLYICTHRHIHSLQENQQKGLRKEKTKCSIKRAGWTRWQSNAILLIERLGEERSCLQKQRKKTNKQTEP